MRGILLILVMACGSGAAPHEEVPAGSAKPVQPAPPPAPEPTIAAVIASDHLKVLALTPTGITVKRNVKLPTPPIDVRWLDREHLVAVDLDGNAYLVTGDTVATYKMPPARAWKAKAGDGETSAKFPTKLTLARTAGGVELSSCETYYMGDDDPCVTWGSVTLGMSLDAGAITTRTDVASDDAVELELTGSPAPTIEWADNADGMHTHLAVKLGTAKRDWTSEEPCPITDAHVKWLSTAPPIISLTVTTDCGEGGPNDEEHLLRLPSLADFSPDGPTLVISPSLWAHGTDAGWTLVAGDHTVSALDGPLVLQPTADPVAPVVPASPTASHLALRRGEKQRAPSVETEWKTPAGTMHATVVDVAYKKARHKPPISKLVVWSAGKRFNIVRSSRACDAFAELRAKEMLVFRCASRPVGDDPEGMIEDWLVRWNKDKKAPLRNKHWSGDPAAAEPAWAK